MDVATLKSRRPAYAVCLIGAAGSGKTQQGCTFPKVYYIGTDPTGLDTVLRNPENAKLVANVVAGNVLNGLPAEDVFADDETSESSIYGNIALACDMAERGEIRTIFLDNLTYLLEPMYWRFIGGDKAVDTRQAYRQVAGFAGDLVLSRLLPLANRQGINVVISIHIQRESKEAVEGIENFNSGKRKLEEVGGSKRHVNLKSDLSPMVIGGLRQKIAGMPSAQLWLNNDLQDGKLVYEAYCQKQYVAAWDAEIEAKNRYGLPPTLVLTGASLYATLVQASKRAMEAQKAVAAKATASATKVTSPGDGPPPEPVAVTSGLAPSGQTLINDKERKS